MKHKTSFLEKIQTSLSQAAFIKLILSNKRKKEDSLKAVYVKEVLLKTETKLQFVYRHNTKDITKNYTTENAIREIADLLENYFFQALLQSTTADYNLLLRKDASSSLKKSKATGTKPKSLAHNHTKNRLIKAENNSYLKALGVVNASGNILPKKQKKFKQINKYIEVLAKALEPLQSKEKLHIVDMGAGKGYLTFALYDYLNNQSKNPNITGVELRAELVQKCNTIAKEAQFHKLNFVQGSIEDTKLEQVDVLIALHACDTATDDAIFSGLKANASLIVVAPCCHKQIRKQLKPTNHLKAISKHGILKERQAELITDTIRALILESKGYQTKVFEFIETEHTPKNVMIVATKKSKNTARSQKAIQEIEAIKKSFGISHHYLETLCFPKKVNN